GYLAPEHSLLAQLTKKAGVYLFGVLILEIVSGRSSSKAAFGEELLVLVLVAWVGAQTTTCRYGKVLPLCFNGQMFALQTWKPRVECWLLDIVDPELTDFREDKVLSYIKVALFCTQGTSHQRPSMKLAVEMLSKKVILNKAALSEPGLYRRHSPQHFPCCSSQETSSSRALKGKQNVDDFVTSNQFDSVSQMLPRRCPSPQPICILPHTQAAWLGCGGGFMWGGGLCLSFLRSWRILESSVGFPGFGPWITKMDGLFSLSFSSFPLVSIAGTSFGMSSEIALQ
ncbi:hypothetical protein RJ641_024614, partial [Dillenia turbinata]